MVCQEMMMMGNTILLLTSVVSFSSERLCFLMKLCWLSTEIRESEEFSSRRTSRALSNRWTIPGSTSMSKTTQSSIWDNTSHFDCESFKSAYKGTLASTEVQTNLVLGFTIISLLQQFQTNLVFELYHKIPLMQLSSNISGVGVVWRSYQNTSASI